MKVRLRQRARRDLRDILSYGVAEHGAAIAESYLREIDEALNGLAGYPRLGVARPDLGENLRCLALREHHIFYVAYPDRVSVFRVLHKAMDGHRHL